MTILDRLERHLGRFAIPGLIRYVAAFNALVFLLIVLNPGYGAFLALDADLIRQGQVWRLISWIFLPTTTSFLWIFFYISFLWFIGDSLEATWGAFRLNLYYLLGIICCTLAAFFVGSSGGNFLLNCSLLLAAATLAPNFEVLFFIFPIKLKWLALISLAYPWGLYFVLGDMNIKLMIVICLGNYLLFFGPHFVREARHTRTVKVRRAKFAAAQATDDTLHRCATCGITEITHPDADFRVTPDGHEYCLEHVPAKNA